MHDDGRSKAPLSACQSLFWKGHQLAPDMPVYNMAWRFDLFLELDPSIFARAFADVAAASDVMRAVFVEGADGSEQRLASGVPALPEVIDLSGQPEDALTAWLDDWVAEPFDLAEASYRCQLINLAPDHWVWCINQHHIACDAQSGAVLFDAMSERYQALLEGHIDAPVVLPSYFDTVVGWVSESSAEAPSETAPVVAATRPYGAERSRAVASERVAVDIDDELQADIDQFITDPDFRLFTPDLSLFAVYLTAYAAFLHRVTGDERLRVGVPAHNRLSERERASLGLFVEVLPFDLEIDTGDTFRDLYGKVKTALGAFLRKARPNAVLAESGEGIGAVLNFIPAKFGNFAGAPVKVEWRHSGAQDADHAFRLHVMEFGGAGRPEVALDVIESVREVARPEHIAGHFKRMLRACVATPDVAIASADLCGDAERAVVMSFRKGASESDALGTVLDLFAAQVEAKPDAIALTCGETEMTYFALAAASDALAARLVAEGVAPGDAVVVHMRRAPEIVVAMLGILKAGAAFVPIAANTPAARCNDIVALSQAKFSIADDACRVVLEETGTKVLSPEVSSAEAVNIPVSMESAAYILFTSGSTGVPKGVVVDHDGLARYIQWAARELGGGSAADYALFSSISFDLTITSIFAPLVSGGRAVIYPETSDPDLAVLDVFADDAVEVVKLTPSHLALVCEAAHAVRRIRTLVLGGENLTSALCQRALEILSPDVEIINEYGPTEAVVGAMVHRFDPSRDTQASVPIGRPADGVEITIRDAALNSVPFGVTGEICIGGRLAQGYFGRDDLTAERFVTDPKGHRLYRTGDTGRLCADGFVEYLGRSDLQLKINGVRIETAEIEAAILAAPGVRAAHVRTGSGGLPSEITRTCTRCGIANNFPGITFSAGGVCDVCHQFDAIKERAEAYFETPQVLADKIADVAARKNGKYDAIMLLSGGKDSTYAAYRLADLTQNVLALTLDNGFLSDEAMANISRVTEHLGWDHRFMRTDAMNEIFVDSLRSFSNVCQGCFKTVYTLALRVARDEGVPAIVTGLSRGQFFETRLTPDLFTSGCPATSELDALVAEARKSYHAKDDAVARLLKTDDILADNLLETVEFIDLYRYIDVPVSEIYRYLGAHAPWRRPDDTGRSTNCRINDVGIYVHKKREGYHNYALPYSWDVRMGHKTRDQALHELNDEIDEGVVQGILDEIGYDDPLTPAADRNGIVAYAAVAPGASEAAVWDAIRARLPRDVQPAHLVLLEHLPLTANGKVDTALLPLPRADSRRSSVAAVAPRDEDERRLAAIFQAVLGVADMGVHDDFFELGGDSLAAIKIAMRANEDGLALPATALFSHPTVARLAAAFGGVVAEPHAPAAVPEEPLLELDADDLASVTRALS